MSPSITPSGVERTFRTDEIIVTKTDLQGRITYANDVFLRVSAYPEEEMLGRPHNMIRHPDMPAGVFRLLWERLQSGRELFAYVVNLAGDGGHYWVFAHVTPTFGVDGTLVGYHSNRRVPSRRAIEAVLPLYAEMRRAEAAGAGSVDAARRGYELLEQRLADHGSTYDEWVWSLTRGAAA